MLAIFVLPASQELNYSENLANNYQNAQQQTQTQVQTVVAIQHLPQTQTQPRIQPILEKKSVENPPHFVAAPLAVHAPIRAGPQFS